MSNFNLVLSLDLHDNTSFYYLENSFCKNFSFKSSQSYHAMLRARAYRNHHRWLSFKEDVTPLPSVAISMLPPEEYYSPAWVRKVTCVRQCMVSSKEQFFMRQFITSLFVFLTNLKQEVDFLKYSTWHSTTDDTALTLWDLNFIIAKIRHFGSLLGLYFIIWKYDSERIPQV